MNLQEIKAAVDAGKIVHWQNERYVVTKHFGNYYIKCGDSVIGLTHQDGTTLNGQPEEFYVGKNMQAIADFINLNVLITPYVHLQVNDSIGDSVCLRGSFDQKDTWQNQIRENSRHFLFQFTPNNGERYYKKDEPVTVELLTKDSSLPKFRKYTGPIHKITDKLNLWIVGIMQQE